MGKYLVSIYLGRYYCVGMFLSPVDERRQREHNSASRREAPAKWLSVLTETNERRQEHLCNLFNAVPAGNGKQTQDVPQVV